MSEEKNTPASALSQMINTSVDNYLNGSVDVKPGITNWNTHRRLKLLNLFWLQVYETGNVDSQGRYKYWYDIITRYTEDEVKATDINTNSIMAFSFFQADTTANFLLSAKLRDHFKTTEEGIELNDTKEKWSAFGSTIWKKVGNGKETMDLETTYVLNQKAEYITHPSTGKVHSSVCEWHSYDQTDLAEKEGVWFKKKIEKLMAEGGKNEKKKQENDQGETKEESKEWELYEYNGYVSLRELKSVRIANGLKEKIEDGDEFKQVLAKIVKPVESSDDDAILYAKTIKKMPYNEAHRGIYKGTWLREGMIAILLENQNEANEIGNNIMNGLEFASKIIFSSEERSLVENILTDLQNGDIVKGKLSQVNGRLHNLDQLIAKWNLNLQEADRKSKIMDLSRGEQGYAGMPYKLGALLDARGSQFHNYLRQKFALAYKKVIREWILPELVTNLKAQDVMELTGDLQYMQRYQEMAVQGWFMRNIEIYGMLDQAAQEEIKTAKMEVLKKQPKAMVKLAKDMWLGVLKRTDVIIVGESMDLYKELQNHATFINLEADPVRRSALIERAYHLTGIDISMLPKTEQQQMAGQGLAQTMGGDMEEMLKNAMALKQEEKA